MVALVAIMQDEGEYVPRWLAGWARFKDCFAEAAVLDGGSQDATVDLLESAGVRVETHPFERDFAKQRNLAVAYTTADWILHIDADELLSVPLLAGLEAIVQNCDESGVDVVGIPRLNFHGFRLQAGVGSRGLDYQYRLHRRHCRWVGRVHEEIVGYKARIELNMLDGHFIGHYKDQERHERRNAFYEEMAR